MLVAYFRFLGAEEEDRDTHIFFPYRNLPLKELSQFLDGFKRPCRISLINMGETQRENGVYIAAEYIEILVAPGIDLSDVFSQVDYSPELPLTIHLISQVNIDEEFEYHLGKYYNLLKAS